MARQSALDSQVLRERVREEHSSPLAALMALAAEWMAPMATPERFANHLSFRCMDLADTAAAAGTGDQRHAVPSRPIR
jgi:hypothetical protein